MAAPISNRERSTGSGPRLVVWLTAALIPAFALTAAVTQGYRSEQRRLGAEWYDRGEQALSDGRPDEAIEAFRTALTFSRDDRRFRLRLAQALMEADRTSEARAYLLTLLEAQPGNGQVNLELARLAAGDGDVPGALRYYHGAIEGAWVDAAEGRRRSVRTELAEFLVNQRALVQAQAELIVLQGDLPPDPAVQVRVADLMIEAGLERRALGIYEQLVTASPRDRVALAGAGRAAFADGRYTAASSYLKRAVTAGASDPDLAQTLETAQLVLALDPFQRRLSTRDRASRARRAFDAAADRLRQCADLDNPELQQLDAEAQAMEPTVTRTLPRDPDAVEPVMDLVFRIQQATEACGEPSSMDRALLLIAQQRQAGAP